MDENKESVVEEATETKAEESNIFRLDEMSDAIDASMSNIKEVTEGQKKIINILKNVNSDDLKELIESLESQVEYMTTQYEELESRKAKLNYVLTSCRDNKDIEHLIDMLLAGVGIFKN